MSLRDLDQRALRRSARWLRGVHRRAAERRSAAARGGATLLVALHDVDLRYARRGPLATLRDLPQVGALALALVIVIGAGTVLDRTSGDATNDPVPTPEPGITTSHVPGPSGYVGPRLGDDVPTYIARSVAELRARATGTPDARLVAVVSLATYRTPKQVAALVGQLQVVRIFFRVPPPPAQTAVNQGRVLTNLLTDADRAFETTAEVRRRAAAELRRVAQKLTGSDPAQQRLREYNLITAGTLEHEARVLRPGCACVFGFVVDGQARQLVAMSTSPGVRLVDPGPAGAQLPELVFRALLPEERKIVTGGYEVVPRG